MTFYHHGSMIRSKLKTEHCVGCQERYPVEWGHVAACEILKAQRKADELGIEQVYFSTHGEWMRDLGILPLAKLSARLQEEKCLEPTEDRLHRVIYTKRYKEAWFGPRWAVLVAGNSRLYGPPSSRKMLLECMRDMTTEERADADAALRSAHALDTAHGAPSLIRRWHSERYGKRP